MIRTIHTRTGTAALVVAAALATSAPANADPTDLRTPDARDASTQRHAGTTWAAGPDLRSIDARDATQAPGGAVTRVDTRNPRVVQITAGGFQWDDAAIGAGGTLGIVLILAGGTAAITRRHRTAGRLAT